MQPAFCETCTIYLSNLFNCCKTLNSYMYNDRSIIYRIIFKYNSHSILTVVLRYDHENYL